MPDSCGDCAYRGVRSVYGSYGPGVERREPACTHPVWPESRRPLLSRDDSHPAWCPGASWEDAGPPLYRADGRQIGMVRPAAPDELSGPAAPAPVRTEVGCQAVPVVTVMRTAEELASAFGADFLEPSRMSNRVFSADRAVLWPLAELCSDPVEVVSTHLRFDRTPVDLGTDLVLVRIAGEATLVGWNQRFTPTYADGKTPNWDGSWMLCTRPAVAPVRVVATLVPTGPTSAPTWTLSAGDRAEPLPTRQSPPPFEAANEAFKAWSQEGLTYGRR